jgi:hypothetical protein
MRYVQSKIAPKLSYWSSWQRIRTRRRSPSLFYLLTVGVEVVYFHLITPKHTPQSVGLLWTRDRQVAGTSTWQHKHLQDTNIHAPHGIRTHDPSKRSATDLHLRSAAELENRKYSYKWQHVWPTLPVGAVDAERWHKRSSFQDGTVLCLETLF